jgi:hypothetical protein
MGMKYPVGYHAGYQKLKIAVVFPEQLFRDVVKMAKAEKKSFNDMVVDLVKCGKLDLEESDRHELPGQPHAGAGHG